VRVNFQSRPHVGVTQLLFKDREGNGCLRQFGCKPMSESVEPCTMFGHSKPLQQRLQRILHNSLAFARTCAGSVRKQQARRVWLPATVEVVRKPNFQCGRHKQQGDGVPGFRLADFSRAVVGRFVREDNFAVEVHIVAVQSKHFSGPQASHPCNRDGQSFSRMAGRAGEMQEGRGSGQWTTAARPVGGARAGAVPVLKAIPVTAVALFC